MDLYATVAPDLIVLDLHRVDHDGLEIMRRIRAHVDLADYLPILVVSADITDETRHAALSTGARDFLTKPVSENELVLRVRTLLKIRLLYLKLQRHNERLQRMVDERSRALQVDLAKSLAPEKAGLRSEERYRWLFDGNLAGVFRSRADGQFLDINDKAAQILGCASARDAREHRLDEFFADPQSYASLLGTLRTEDGVVNHELLMRRRDRSPVWLSLTARMTGAAAGDAIEATILDVTERKTIEEHLRRSQKLELDGQVAASVAHDFNNMLTVISAYCDLLLDERSEGQSVRHWVTEIKRAAGRAAVLTRQLLAFSRHQTFEPQLVDLGAVVVEAKEMIERVMGNGVQVTVERTGAAGMVYADFDQIEQVLLNLATNARDAMPSGGRLAIRVANTVLDSAFVQSHLGAVAGEYVVLSVEDTGHGMAPEVQARIFEPFFTTKERGRGTGLGLATVFGIVKQSGGYTDLTSAVGVGSTFRIYFPRPLTTAPAPARPLS